MNPSWSYGTEFSSGYSASDVDLFLTVAATFQFLFNRFSFLGFLQVGWVSKKELLGTSGDGYSSGLVAITA